MTTPASRIDATAPLAAFFCWVGFAFTSWAALLLGGPEPKALFFLVWETLPWLLAYPSIVAKGRKPFSSHWPTLCAASASAAIAASAAFSVERGADSKLLLLFLPLIIAAVWTFFDIFVRKVARHRE